MGERGNWSSLSVMKRGRTGDWRMERSSLLKVASSATWTMVRGQPELLLRAMSESVAMR